MNRSITYCFLSTALCTAAHAQQGWHMELDRVVVTPTNPTVTLRLSAGYPLPMFHAFAAALVDLIATEPGWSPGLNLLPPPSNPGTINGPTIAGIIGGQIHFPPKIIANPANPIGFYEVQWTASDFTPRTIEFRTQTHRYDGYHISPFGNGDLTRWVIDPRQEVRIVPAPGGGLLAMCVGMWMAVPRRRSSAYVNSTSRSPAAVASLRMATRR